MGPPALPQRFEVVLVAQGVHRLPEAFVLEGVQLFILGQTRQRLGLPTGFIASDVGQDFG
jgi:hypothetical protein